ncbi:restriction endonuclease [Vibrio crassostreae]|nr:restriction endonuclease [Vibrio crassostreae]CAK1864892.1 restriction system protein [Vibrio crassostreae]CAK1873317.1 restriction system protein [Vibrio crassostreae]CAK1873526.1 restriction system protein [Vibrio crassostreae]CAK1888830.1 restriction system protein [Vibrio crassostreae]CAK1890310.1 restriction system protein [Vibrio crassostreae]
MARKNNGIIWHLMDAPWWLSVLLSACIYFGLSYLLPSLAIESDNFIFKAVAPNLPLMAPYFTFLFLLPAPIAFFKQYKRKRSFLTTCSQVRTHKNTSPLNHLNWIEFESYIGEYFKSQGYTVKQSFTQKPDGGVDIWLTKDNELSLVQCKHWKTRKVGVQVLREMYGVMIANNASKMIIVTSGDFTSEAVAFSLDKRLWLVNGSELVHMIEDGRSFQNRPSTPTPAPKTFCESRTCPRCQSKLVIRVAKRGAKSGMSFYGCSTYPKCRYTCDC